MQTEAPMARPLVSLAACYGLGLVLGHLWPQAAWPLYAVALLLALSLGFLAWKRIGAELRFLLWMGLVLVLGWAALPSPKANAQFPDGRLHIVGRALNAPVSAGKGLKLDVQLEGLAPIGSPMGPADHRISLSIDQRTRCPVVLTGDRLRWMGRLRAPRHRRNFHRADPAERKARMGVQAQGWLHDCSRLLVDERPAEAYALRWVDRWRQELREAIASRSASQQARALLQALSLGDAGSVSPALRQDFARSGLAHLLAVSGLHLGFAALGLYGLLVFFFLRIRPLALRVDVRSLAAGLCLPAVCAITLLAGARLPTLRACVMVLAFLLAVMLRRRVDPLQTLAAAALFILALWPAALFELSFQLSVVAVLSVLIIAPALARRLRIPWGQMLEGSRPRKFIHRLLQLLLVSMAVSLGSWPIVARAFHQVSLSGLGANLLAVPLCTWLIVPLGLGAAVVQPVSEVMAAGLHEAALVLCEVLASLARGAAALPGAGLSASPGSLDLALWYVALGAALWGWSFRWGRRLLWSACILLLLSGAWTLSGLERKDRLDLVMLDVGQAESLLLRLPDGRNWLVDGGNRFGDYDAGRAVVVPALRALGVRQLDAVVATHCHPDHIGGLASILEVFEPKRLIVPPHFPGCDPEQHRGLKELRQQMAKGRTELDLWRAGREEMLGQVRLRVLWPSVHTGDLEENARSLVMRLDYAGRSLLLTGDLDGEGEAALLSCEAVDVDVLKVGHHGSRTASSEAFLRLVTPEEALISVGGNNHYGLPNRDVLKRLRRHGARVWRSDLHGAVRVRVEADGDLEVEAVSVGVQQGST